MTNREKFIEEIENSLHSEGGLLLSADARLYFEELKGGKASIGGMTEIGKAVLTWVFNAGPHGTFYSAKTIGEGLFTSSRVVSGAARKLIADGYLEKEGKNPVMYAITADGHNFLLGDELS